MGREEIAAEAKTRLFIVKSKVAYLPQRESAKRDGVGAAVVDEEWRADVRAPGASLPTFSLVDFRLSLAKLS
jgi:hypothetical protein